MVKTASFKRLILRAVLRQVSPMVIRLVSVADQMPPHEFHDVFRTILGWNGDLGYIVRVHILLQTRTKLLNEDLDDLFRRWCPRFRPHHKCRSQTATRLDPRLFGALHTVIWLQAAVALAHNGASLYARWRKIAKPSRVPATR